MKRIIIVVVVLPLLIQLGFCTSQKIDLIQIKEGDIIFHESMSAQSKAIRLATGSRYTHVGIIFRNRGKLYVLEAVQPVRISSIHNFIKRGKDRHYVIKRLRNYESYMTKWVLAGMKKLGRSFLGKNYDLYFEWSDRRIYCSELVWKLYYRVAKIKVGKLEKLSDFDLTHPYVKKLMRKRYGNSVPLNETVISPVSMLNSDLLYTVYPPW